MDGVMQGIEIGGALVGLVLTALGARKVVRARRGKITERSVPTPGAAVAGRAGSDDVGRDPYPTERR